MVDEAKNVFNKAAQDYAEKFMKVDQYANGLYYFMRELPGLGDVLDLACGPGNLTNWLVTQRPDLLITGIDFAPNMISIAQKNIPDADFLVHDILKIKELNNQWEGIVFGFGLPYIPMESAKQLIADMGASLVPTGPLYLSVLEGEYEDSQIRTSSDGKNQLQQYFYSEDFLRTELTKNGFEIIFTERVSQTEPIPDSKDDLIIVAIRA